MSLEFKLLRENAGITKQELAEQLNVDYRTVTNWEKENGTIPSLLIVSEIARIMKLSSYDVFEAYLSLTPKDRYNDDFSRLDNYPRGDISPKRFFKYLFSTSVGETEIKDGIVQYNSRIFHFNVAMPISREYTGEIRNVGELIKTGGISLVPVEFIDKQSAKEYFEYPYYGWFVADAHMNIIVFCEDNVQTCRFISKSYGNITYEIVLNTAIFPEMEQEITSTQKCSVLLTIFDYGRNEFISNCFAEDWISQYQFGFDKNNVIGKFIKSVRMSLGLNQTEFAEGIITPFDGPYQCQEISNKTINKWETGTAYPSLLQLFLLGESYNFSVKKLFDQFDSGFFVKSEIENIDRTYDIGLNYEFSRSTELEHWLRFVTLFKLAKRAISGFFNNFNILGEADIENCKSVISNISYSNSEIVIELRNKSIISIPMEQVKIIEAKNVLNNLLYEFQLALGEKTSRTIKLSFSFFVRDDTDE